MTVIGTLGVQIGDYNTRTNWGLMWTGLEISEPQLITNYVEIPGRKTKLDATETVNGGRRYKNRELKLTFEKRLLWDEWDELGSTIRNAINGKRVKIILDTDPDYYWMGRITVSGDHPEYTIGQYVLTCDVEPYKYKDHASTSYSVSAGGTKTISGTTAATVSVYSSVNQTLTTGGYSYSLLSGKTTKINVDLPATLKFSAASTVIISYVEESL